MEQVGGEGEFRKEILWSLHKPGASFHPRTVLPRSSPVFLLALGLSGRCEHVVPAGLAVELFLAACDLLDSLEDEEVVFGVSEAQALNRATALLLLSHISMDGLWKSNEPAKARLATQALEIAAIRACQGQSLDLAFESREAVTEGEYLQMIELKSAAPFSAACWVGALLSTTDEQKVRPAAQYGKWLGMAVQLRNDALAIASGVSRSDIRRRKKTLPIIYALGKAEGKEGAFLSQAYTVARGLAPEEELRIRDIVLGCGGVHYAMVFAQVYRQRAIEQIDGTGVAADIASKLREMVMFF